MNAWISHQKYSLPGHPIEQKSFVKSYPLQFSPPKAGAGLEHILDRVLEPWQCTFPSMHAVQGDQSDQYPSTEGGA